MARNESQFWYYLKKNTPTIKWTRIENTSSLGTPDLLGYNFNNHFFTLELKVTRSKKIKFSPHQIAFHVKHPHNSFILVEDLGQSTAKLFRGSRIEELEACGLSLDACCLGLDACRLRLNNLESLRTNLAGSLMLGACAFDHKGWLWIKLEAGPRRTLFGPRRILFANGLVPIARSI